MIKYHKIPYLGCDTCGRSIHTNNQTFNEAKEREAAVAFGWKCDESGDICTDCQEAKGDTNER
jgi:hypothetical protein